MMEVIGIVAISDNRVIGNRGGIPWSIKQDMEQFKLLTSDHVVIMGHKTFESLPMGSLSDRHNIVVTRKGFESPHKAQAVLSPEEALSSARHNGYQKAFVIGGAEIYRAMEPEISCWHITRVHADIEGDIYFTPALTDFIQDYNILFDDERSKIPFSFQCYKRIKTLI